MRDLLFVYGSFSEGMVHYNRISSAIESSQPGSVFGTVFRLPVGYPAYHSQGAQKIEGHLIKLQKPEVLIPLLDQFHGYSQLDLDKSLFHRVMAEAQTESGEKVLTQVYSVNLKRLSPRAEVIMDGDWKKALIEKPALTEKLTEKQRLYVVKLGKSSGRDIVPIDLNLYRELLKLELVVDKGRRLALTSLGQDVFKFLS
jgi:gamma-glutamylcyclotransferase (GGCT)/AIG2-like uncharacterized protein YtfP